MYRRTYPTTQGIKVYYEPNYHEKIKYFKLKELFEIPPAILIEFIDYFYPGNFYGRSWKQQLKAFYKDLHPELKEKFTTSLKAFQRKMELSDESPNPEPLNRDSPSISITN